MIREPAAVAKRAATHAGVGGAGDVTGAAWDVRVPTAICPGSNGLKGG